MPIPLRSLSVSTEGIALPPGVWQADQWGASRERVQGTGHAALDAQLPGGGWPLGALTEVLQPAHCTHEWQLVLPALVQLARQQPGVVMLVAPVHEPFAPVLQAHGLPPERLCRVTPGDAASALWVSEQALRCGDVLAVLAWLPQAQSAALRRLQLAAAQRQSLCWLFRPASVSQQASPAPLRLLVEGANPMHLRILKRRGPSLAQTLVLPACGQHLGRVLEAQALRRRAVAPGRLLPTARQEVVHALDRLTLAAC